MTSSLLLFPWTVSQMMNIVRAVFLLLILCDICSTSRLYTWKWGCQHSFFSSRAEEDIQSLLIRDVNQLHLVQQVHVHLHRRDAANWGYKKTERYEILYTHVHVSASTTITSTTHVSCSLWYKGEPTTDRHPHHAGRPPRRNAVFLWAWAAVLHPHLEASGHAQSQLGQQQDPKLAFTPVKFNFLYLECWG